MSSLYAATPVRSVDVEGTQLAYREFGDQSGVPLVLFSRFRGSIDDWDPAVIELLSQERHVVTFDNAGVGFSDGEVGANITEMAKTAVEFIKTLGIEKADLLGFSMGGYIAQRIALTEPELVRNVILVGTGPGGGEGATYPGPDVEHWVNAVRDPELTFQALWFNGKPTGKAATRAYMERIYTPERPERANVTAEAGAKLRAAIVDWWEGNGSTLPELENIQHPVLVVNGSNDVMVPTPNSFLMAQRIPNAQLIIYPDSGHASLFQYPETFSEHVLKFLRDQENGGLK